MEENKEKRVKDLIESMKKDRGYIPPPWPYAVEKDVDFMENQNTVYNLTMNTGDPLPIKTKELIAIAMIAFRGMKDGMYAHMKRALSHGATKEEIFEALKVSMLFGGAPTFATGMQTLWEIAEEEKREAK